MCVCVRPFPSCVHVNLEMSELKYVSIRLNVLFLVRIMHVPPHSPVWVTFVRVKRVQASYLMSIDIDVTCCCLYRGSTAARTSAGVHGSCGNSRRERELQALRRALHSVSTSYTFDLSYIFRLRCNSPCRVSRLIQSLSWACKRL